MDWFLYDNVLRHERDIQKHLAGCINESPKMFE